MAPRRRPARWWEALPPAGVWLFAARSVLGAAKLWQWNGFRWPALTFALLRLSSRLFRAGFR
jgi:hypothetical protein